MQSYQLFTNKQVDIATLLVMRVGLWYKSIVFERTTLKLMSL